jgi:hypothetical protein
MSILAQRRYIDGVPQLSKNDIEDIATDLLSRFNRDLICTPGPVDIDLFAEQFLGLQLDFVDLSHNGSILGLIAFKDCNVDTYDSEANDIRSIPVKKGTALIDNALSREDQYGRGRFTIAHECGHWVIHRPEDHDTYQPSLFDLSLVETSNGYIKCRKGDSSVAGKMPQTPDEWREWQADNLASAILMPIEAVKNQVKKILNGTTPVRQLLKRQDGSCINISSGVLAFEIARTFEVSVQAASVRLRKLGYLSDDPSDPIRIPY